jgi:hypothetical protein
VADAVACCTVDSSTPIYRLNNKLGPKIPNVWHDEFWWTLCLYTMTIYGGGSIDLEYVRGIRKEGIALIYLLVFFCLLPPLVAFCDSRKSH